MKLGVPWSVKGIRPEARETAREAARRSGMSLGDWLNSVILQQAAESGLHDDDDDDDSYGDELSSVHQRLDDLSRRIEQFTRTGPAAYAPKRDTRGRNDTDQIAELIGRLDRRLEQFVNAAARPMPMMPPGMAPPMAPMMPQGMPPTLDRAVAEIAARQRALSGQPAQAAPARPPAMPQPAPMPSPALVPVPTQNLTGLEDQLRRITDQIETLRRPGVEEAINALRGELGEIGRALNDAMPRRAIDTIEKQIAGLTQRIAEGRQNGGDHGALGNIEHGLAEVRDALRGLTPAENLVGFNDAVHALAHKIDLIVAQKDPATLQQLEHAITTLRDMASHVASNDAIGALAQKVEMLAAKVDNIGGGGGVAGDALTNLEHRIGALADALAERAQAGGSVPPRLEALVQSLSDKIEQIQQSRGDNVASSHLEDQIVALVQRLDASDSRLGHLEAVERGLADLLVHIQEMRSAKQAGGLTPENAAGVDALKHDLARTQNALEAVNGTLGHVVDRLAMIEKDIRGGDRRAPAPMAAPALVPDSEPLDLTQPVGKLAVRAVEHAPPAAPRMPPATPLQMPISAAPAPAAPAPRQQRPQPQPQPQAAPAPRRMVPANHGPIDPSLPPDEPIEPGSAPPRGRAGARIAASEAALGGANPEPAAGAKSSFIAAARRAAQAAMKEATARLPRAAAPEVEAVEEVEVFDELDAPPSLRRRLMKRVKSLLIAASIVAIIVGGIQIVGSLFLSDPEPPKSKDAKVSETETVDRRPARVVSGPAVNRPEAPKAADRVAAGTPGAMFNTLPTPTMTAPPIPSLLGPPTLSMVPLPTPSPAPPAPPATPSSDVTGSIAKSGNGPAARPAPALVPGAERLPIAIGGAKLRNAAASGDATAAYEIALRFAEGRGVPVNFEEAARWYERAASKGLAPAQFRYATLLEKGQGVKKDLGQARRLYLAAAARGNAKAMHNLAVLYAEGIEGRPDYNTAAQWFRKAARHGVGDSQYNLGVLYARGLGTEKNLAESYKWFALAEAQGDKEAARKRDEVAGQLDGQALAAAEQAVKTFRPEPQPHEATTVAVPPGGWDEAVSAPTAHGKARTTGRPLSLGAYTSGKR